MTDTSFLPFITFLLGSTLLVTIGIAIYLGLKARGSKSRKHKKAKPKFTSANTDTSSTASYTPASEVELADTFKRIDEVLGEVTVNGISYTTFDAGEVYIYDKKKNPVIAFKVDGYGNDQRTINYIKVSNHIDKENGVIFYVKHNHADFQLFDNWLAQQMYGGDYAREALYFKDLMTEIAKFNQLLASRTIRKKLGRYITQ